MFKEWKEKSFCAVRSCAGAHGAQGAQGARPRKLIQILPCWRGLCATSQVTSGVIGRHLSAVPTPRVQMFLLLLFRQQIEEDVGHLVMSVRSPIPLPHGRPPVHTHARRKVISIDRSHWLTAAAASRTRTALNQTLTSSRASDGPSRTPPLSRSVCCRSFLSFPWLPDAKKTTPLLKAQSVISLGEKGKMANVGFLNGRGLWPNIKGTFRTLISEFLAGQKVRCEGIRELINDRQTRDKGQQNTFRWSDVEIGCFTF